MIRLESVTKRWPNDQFAVHELSRELAEGAPRFALGIALPASDLADVQTSKPAV